MGFPVTHFDEMPASVSFFFQFKENQSFIWETRFSDGHLGKEYIRSRVVLVSEYHNVNDS